jgi:hypothetical protein
VDELVFGPDSQKELSNARKLENLFLVGAGIRPSSMFHPESIEEIIIVHDVAKRLGMGMVVRKCGTLVYKVFLFKKGKEDIASRIPDFYESMGFKQFIVAQITIANLTGQFLDFPECCVNSFVKHLMEGTDQDLEAHEELRQERSPDPRAFFIERFVPCRVKCENAIKEGDRIEKALRKYDKELTDLYVELRFRHMEDVRLGRILKEKKERDEQFSLPVPKIADDSK